MNAVVFAMSDMAPARVPHGNWEIENRKQGYVLMYEDVYGKIGHIGEHGWVFGYGNRDFYEKYLEENKIPYLSWWLVSYTATPGRTDHRTLYGSIRDKSFALDTAEKIKHNHIIEISRGR